MMNPVLRQKESGGFRWRFYRFWLDISTLSGNFKGRWTAGEHPYGYLSSGDDVQVQGFAERIYLISTLMTTDQRFVDDIDKALDRYNKRLQKAAEKEAKVEDELEEAAALEQEKQVQQYVEAPKKEKKKMEKAVDKKFKKVVKNEGKN